MFNRYMHMVQTDRKRQSKAQEVEEGLKELKYSGIQHVALRPSSGKPYLQKFKKYDKFVYYLENVTDGYRPED
jgi:hypothetical protein